MDQSKDTYELWKQELIIKPSIKAEEEEKASKKDCIRSPPECQPAQLVESFFQRLGFMGRD
jgi:hypothetical protein